MKNERHTHMALPLSLLGLAFMAFVMTGPSHADSGKSEIFGPFQPIKIVLGPQQDNQEIRQLISEQLDAIRDRDAEQAYALTTGVLHDKFDTASKFLSDMRFSYRPVYNHESYRFLDQSETETGGLIQRVEMSYTHGDPAIVIYRLKRTADGMWGIDSFSVLEDDEGQDI